ncbi:hypothetical protein AAG570_011025 [Ranatra chinensis]|uniref:Uncharacterized protein n=1 Tax=Ranatra chinensis TaxID=642074 RepID=A0ABD0Z5Q2_9HEMI
MFNWIVVFSMATFVSGAVATLFYGADTPRWDPVCLEDIDIVVVLPQTNGTGYTATYRTGQRPLPSDPWRRREEQERHRWEHERNEEDHKRGHEGGHKRGHEGGHKRGREVDLKKGHDWDRDWDREEYNGDEIERWLEEALGRKLVGDEVAVAINWSLGSKLSELAGLTVDLPQRQVSLDRILRPPLVLAVLPKRLLRKKGFTLPA